MIMSQKKMDIGIGISLGVLAIGLSCIIGAGMFTIISNRAMAQMETCPYGYYLATNNLCYQYPQQQANNSTTAADPDLIHICKINRDMIAVDKGLGVNDSQLLPLVNLYNDVCGTLTGVK
jgi:hypothetical protein